jgi:hypothetical protein
MKLALDKILPEEGSCQGRGWWQITRKHVDWQERQVAANSSRGRRLNILSSAHSNTRPLAVRDHARCGTLD